MRLTLPYPPAQLSPNSRDHRMNRAVVTKKYRTDCFYAARAAGVLPSNAEAAHLTLTFHAPDKRRRDLDNMLASFKAGLDGISDALGMDDSRWTLTIRRGEPRPKGGVVVVEIDEDGSTVEIPLRGVVT